MNRIEIGDCRETMRRWACQGVKAQMCVTSPPYFGLRSYLPDNSPDKPLEIGLEETPDQYIARMVDVFRAVRDVLADDGTLWLNIGDSYASSPPGNKTVGVSAKSGLNGVNGASGTYRETLASGHATKRDTSKLPGIKPKDLIGIPWMLAFALRADGWFLRQDIVWHKPSPMPESVRDRCTKAHEYIFLLSKSERYFFDSEAMKEPASKNTHPRRSRVAQAALGDGIGHREGPPGNPAPRKLATGRDGTGFMVKNNASFDQAMAVMPDRRNRRSVWTVATRPYSGAHFATFPPALIEPCILAGTSERGHCPACGARWAREVERSTSFEGGSGKAGRTAGDVNASGKHIGGIHGGNKNLKLGSVVRSTTTGWRPTCACGCEPVPDVVLDPFMGSGTTAAVALQHGRKYLGCELNPEYAALQRERIAGTVGPLFAEVA